MDRLVELLDEYPDASVSTLAVELGHRDASLDSPHAVKVVCDASRRALYFSRSRIPASHPTASQICGGLRHIGLYGYRIDALRRFAEATPSALERCEGLEQLRLLEAGEHVVVGVVDDIPAGVDTADILQGVQHNPPWQESTRTARLGEGECVPGFNRAARLDWPAYASAQNATMAPDRPHR